MCCDAAQFAVDENLAPVLSLSFGACEAYNLASFRAVAQQASAQGITWLASSGDTGAAECDRVSAIPQAAKGLSVGFPASIPEITSVGGTQFDDANGKYWAATNGPSGASALGYIPETVWNDTPLVNGFSGGGGGASILFPKPFWQTGPGVPDDKARDIPDISLSASADHVGYQVFVYGDLYTVGGTSASAPSLAGVVALLNQYLASKSVLAKPGLGNINPTLYRLAQSSNNIFHDVTTGDNAVRCALGTPNCVEGFVGYRAGPGYDLATGLGSIDAYNLVTQWNPGTASTTTVIADPGQSRPGRYRATHRHRPRRQRGRRSHGSCLLPGGERSVSHDRYRRFDPQRRHFHRHHYRAGCVGDRRQRHRHRFLQRRQVVQRLLRHASRSA